jgi:hypothetical protein
LEAKTSGVIGGDLARLQVQVQPGSNETLLRMQQENDELSPNCVIAILRASALQYSLPVPPAAQARNNL